jgi:hypothetical protein
MISTITLETIVGAYVVICDIGCALVAEGIFFKNANEKKGQSVHDWLAVYVLILLWPIPALLWTIKSLLTVIRGIPSFLVSIWNLLKGAIAN